MTVTERICEYIRQHSYCTELDVARALYGPAAVQQQVNAHLRRLAQAGLVLRDRSSGIYTYTWTGNAAAADDVPPPPTPPDKPSPQPLPGLSEDEIKTILHAWLTDQGCRVRVMMGKERGIDIEAHNDEKQERWIIEVKGAGSRPQMRVNYFLAMLGETLQRMEDPDAAYSIAMSDLPQFRRLWERLPRLAKKRTGITALFVGQNGEVTHTD